MPPDLFGEDRHDPGSNVSFPLQPGVQGDSSFLGECDAYRPVLRRWWGDSSAYAFALWIGMNPSTAVATRDDRTIRRELDFTRRMGFEVYIKTNVCDYRSTKPKGMLAPGVQPRSPDNLAIIRGLAGKAARVVLAFGVLPKPLQPLAHETVAALRADGVALWCLGKTASGAPRHPLYVNGNTELVGF